MRRPRSGRSPSRTSLAAAAPRPCRTSGTRSSRRSSLPPTPPPGLRRDASCRDGRRPRAAGRALARRVARAAGALRPRLRRPARGAASRRRARRRSRAHAAEPRRDAGPAFRRCAAARLARQPRPRGGAPARRACRRSGAPRPAEPLQDVLRRDGAGAASSAAFDLAPAIAAAGPWIDRALAAAARVRDGLASRGSAEPCRLIEANGDKAVLRPDRPGRGARRRLLELARHDARNVGRAGARPRAALPLPALRHPRPRPLRGRRRPVSHRRPRRRPRRRSSTRFGIDKAHLVGLSLGGMTAQAFAVALSAAPDKPGADGDLRPSAAGGAVERARNASCAREGMAAIVDDVMARWFIAGHDRAGPRAREAGARPLRVDRSARLCGRVPCHPRHGPARRHRRHPWRRP